MKWTQLFIGMAVGAVAAFFMKRPAPQGGQQ